MSEKRESSIELVPWDCESDEHVERMYNQRVSCGWRCDEVREQWIELTRAGKKTLYWVVLRDDLPGRDELLSRHLAKHPKETSPLRDTATSHFLQARTPSHAPFAPVGHIALDMRPEQDAQLGLVEKNVVWVAGLYVSHALQDGGLGRDTMRRAEEVATAAPLRAEWIVLDTISREQQARSAMLRNMYAAQGRSVPSKTTQDWYERQGYQAFARDVAIFTFVDPETGDSEDIDYLFMKKRMKK